MQRAEIAYLSVLAIDIVFKYFTYNRYDGDAESFL